ncbi:hypothetical protein [Pelagibacterium lentulum]|uniref:Uncharacterized protein n=1 Tax=Pelagibacterium lentulum TaxID=2029865 RepID=A0A916RNF6_9HYPH|nr:hypothetical protein [Pelagibacterium lentulum]GGA60707.1 hypothetical protein GCM10011499_33720 [Pelagibacterium lentulum]
MPLRTALQAIELIQKIAPNVSRPEAERLAPILINQNNQEPWYQSRVTWGAIAAILSGLGTMAGLVAAGDWSPSLWATAVTGVGGGIGTLWGRWGRPKSPLPVLTEAQARAQTGYDGPIERR